MKKVFNVAIVGAHEEEYRSLKNSLESAQFDTTFSITQQEASSLQRVSETTDLTIYCQEEGVSGPDHVPVFVSKTIFVTSCYEKEILYTAFKKGASYVLYRPLHRSEVLLAIRNVLFFSKKYRKANLTDPVILAFLEEVAKSGVHVIEPVSSPFKPTGHFYPDVLKITGELENEEDYLDALSERGFFIKRLRNRVRLCDLCDSYQINYREVCPVCSSIDIVKGQMIHHFECGHVDSLESFKQGTAFVCPKCDQTLRHIGIDYEKPSDYFKCASCHAIVPEPSVELECLVCGLVCRPEETVEKNIYAYELSELAWEAVRSGNIGGLDLGAILYDHHTNLYNKQYVEIELKRELIRMKRYKSEFTLVLARIEKMDEIQRDHPDRVTWYVNTIFQSLTQDLRELDITCVWASNTLCIILSETNLEGALIVVNRINQNIQSLEYLYDVCKPEVTFSAVQGDPAHESAEQIAALAMKDLADE
jgi:diguanylate cyclase (GGDEF)-like protein